MSLLIVLTTFLIAFLLDRTQKKFLRDSVDIEFALPPHKYPTLPAVSSAGAY